MRIMIGENVADRHEQSGHALAKLRTVVRTDVFRDLLENRGNGIKLFQSGKRN